MVFYFARHFRCKIQEIKLAIGESVTFLRTYRLARGRLAEDDLCKSPQGADKSRV